MKYNQEMVRFILMLQYGATDIFFHSYVDKALLKTIDFVTFEMDGKVKHLTIIDKDSPLGDTFDVSGAELRGRDGGLLWTTDGIYIFNVQRIATEIISYRETNGSDALIPISIVKHLFTELKFNKTEDE